MKVNVTLIIGILFALIAFVALAVISVQHPFPDFSYSISNPSSHFVSVTSNIGVEDSQFMWNQNSLNLIAQAFVLFAAAAATLTVLNRYDEEKPT